MKVLSIRLFLVLILIGSVDGLQPAWADGPYRGKVIDAETKEPIEEAVVVAVWTKRILRFLDSTMVFAEAKETLTDKDGEFVIPGYKWTSIFFSFGIQPPRIYIFKPGYGDFPWHRAYPPPKQSNAQLLKPFKTHGLVELPKLKTRQERLEVNYDVGALVPHEKIPNLIKLENIERKNLGLEGEVK